MSKVLQQWQQSCDPAFLARLPHNWERRRFLFGGAKTAAALGFAPLVAQLAACKRPSESPATATPVADPLAQMPWPIFAAVHEILFPVDGKGPSAKDFHATSYLRIVLQTPDVEADERKFILDGVGWLDQYAQEKHRRGFLALTVSQRDGVLRAIAGSEAGERWLAGLLNYLLEALLCDPVYGGNPNEIGWKWIQHQPGFPRPPQPYYRQETL